MKVLIALLVFVAVPASMAMFSPEVFVTLHGIEYDCSKQSGLNSAEIEKIRNNGKQVPLPANNEIINQWAKCMLQKYNVIKSDGTVNMNKDTITIYDDTLSYRFVFPRCKNKIGKDIADTARLMWNCYRANSSGLLMAPMAPPFSRKQ